MVAVRPSSETLAARIEAVGEALAAGAPAASLDLIRQVGAEADALVYWAAIGQRLQGLEFGAALAEMEALLAEAKEAEEDWSQSDEAELSLLTLSAALAPLAGLDVPVGIAYAKVYIESFPPFSLPLGDVDERAAKWLAQLLDVGVTRQGLRNLFYELADLWAGHHPLAAGQVREWAEGPPPDDPTRDGPWMRAMLWLARTQV
jgi:hypothetical protein